MKRIALIIGILLMAVPVHAGFEMCNFIWASPGATGANEAPDYIYCSTNHGSYSSRGASSTMSTRGATQIDISTDSTSTGSLEVNGQTVCSNTATNWDINVLLSMDGTNYDTGTGTLAYYQIDDLGDAEEQSFAVTPAGYDMKLTVDEDAGGNACVVVRVLVYKP